MDKLISIIIPIYNAEKFLKKCIDSIISGIDQYSDICEIILINDGSKDNSGIICDEYSSKYETIKTFHKQNSGVSDSRNLGIEKSIGKYLTFVDSDDYITSDFNKVFNILKKNVNTDVFSFGIKKGEMISSCFNKSLDSKKFVDILWFVENEVTISSCVKIVNRQFIIKNNLYFTKTTKSEDFEWSIRSFLLSSEYKCFDLCYYIYYINQNSVTHTDTFSGFEGHFYNVRKIYELMSDYNITKKQKNILFGKLFEGNFYYLIRTSKICGIDRKNIIELLKSNKDLFFYPRIKTYRIIFFMIKLFGIRFTLYIILLKFRGVNI